jgi:hypothetical protein
MIGRRWMDDVCAALIDRSGDPGSSDECLMVARTAMGVFGAAVEQWVASNADEDFGMLIDRGFELIGKSWRS